MDKLIKYVNENYKDTFNLFYSTPSQYVDAIAAYNVTWPTKTDDMFPYSDGPDAYWTGYFSSRANDKAYVRKASSNFHASSQLYAQKVFDQSASDEQLQSILNAKDKMLDELGINQHHDAVSGTAKQHVADDYANRLTKGMKINNKEYGKLIQENIE